MACAYPFRKIWIAGLESTLRMETMHTIDRNLVVVKPKQPFLDWVKIHLEWEQTVTLDQFSRESTVYLIPEAHNEAKDL